ncbi:polyprenyl synthetase family protein [Loigolactobacillus coryniformis]|jgi:heptaprenyl diphosphate synthase|uniref:Trans-hexaprenyltranstransferase n=2 Tax=Loigolactobacillus coryniformis TaxID=1610 RepID=A0A2D1KKD8_9LACO|nr:polyprenyl synthetase family protein [Loigolactobacillus coryniformis]RRG06142.1 MAG: polyprenyl synthetase family protein [Lactobacillus sp.]ATO42585.1 trans-hexaprenyltranstransferase [Loigolactobacillus coryniformis subsp. torquens DSM 20004 = KCTC 3535]KRK85468.1 trans-hexaprenyltranstransferase, component II [Loigolactobacillus coryniformis subsp. torquens DSM 20004 = KCTC 3535]MDC4185672.1 polyprenyl synthetase family protein [Loigolactobacillus coryniformis]QEA52433.1 polyprenyl synt
MTLQIWDDFPYIQEKLTPLTPYLLEAARIKQPAVNERVQALIHNGGKLVRAGLFYLFSEFGTTPDQARLKAGAAAIELLHLATLIHDDVIDQAAERRHTATVQTSVGNRNAVYAGDLLFTLYFDQVLRSAETFADIDTNVKAMHGILTGELDQYNLNYQLNETVDQYLREIEGKTAKLFALACAQGAKLAHADEIIVETGEQIGRSLGLAYQILDDILDYTGTQDSIRKPILQDIQNGIYTLPLLFTLEAQPTATRAFLSKKARLTTAELQELQQLVIDSGGVTQAQTMANELTDQALIDIQTLPDSRARNDLEKLTRRLLKRQK